LQFAGGLPCGSCRRLRVIIISVFVDANFDERFSR
jgi:hypothetical protein